MKQLRVFPKVLKNGVKQFVFERERYTMIKYSHKGIVFSLSSHKKKQTGGGIFYIIIAQCITLNAQSGTAIIYLYLYWKTY